MIIYHQAITKVQWGNCIKKPTQGRFLNCKIFDNSFLSNQF